MGGKRAAFVPVQYLRPVGNTEDIRMPANANDIPLKDETKRILQGPRILIHKGSNTCLLRERQAIHDLLSKETADIRRHLIVSYKLYSPSSINKNFGSFDAPGKSMPSIPRLEGKKRAGGVNCLIMTYVSSLALCFRLWGD